MALNLYNPFTKVPELEQELANLRQANQRMRQERDFYRDKVADLNEAATEHHSLLRQAKHLLDLLVRTTEPDDYEVREALRHEAIMRMSDVELA